MLAMVVALSLAVAGLLTAARLVEYVAAAIPAFLSTIPLYLIYHSPQSNQPPAVSIGDRIIDFTAPDENGDDFTLSSLAGTAYFLKFYRGQWCPYCIGELMVWRDMDSELKEMGVGQMVYVSTDSPADIRKGKPKHNAVGIQLSDPDLRVAKLFAVENRGKNVTPPHVNVLGLPIPTTILVDSHGIIRWIDQASDYQVRSGMDRVFAAASLLKE